MQLYLASSSPRRIRILSKLNLPFEQITPDIDESVKPTESPYQYVQRLAEEKGAKALSIITATGKSILDSIVIAGDVTVDIDGIALGKAETDSEAAQMLARLSGKTHYIRDGYSIFANGMLFASGVNSAAVTFKHLSQAEIENYVGKLEWKGKAGAYAFQESAGELIAHVSGSYFDILGLPIFNVANILKALGFEIPQQLISQIWEEDKAELKLRSGN